MKNLFLTVMAAFAIIIQASPACANPTMTYAFPGGYQAQVRAQNCPYGCDTATTYFLSHQVTLQWDGSRYVVDGAKVVYDKDHRLFYLHFQDTSDNTVNYGPLYSADDSRQTFDYTPWGYQSPVVSNGTTWTDNVPSYFLTDQVKLHWDYSISAYVLNDSWLAYDRYSKHFYVFDGERWAGAFPQ